jgi:hypothetical protein
MVYGLRIYVLVKTTPVMFPHLYLTYAQYRVTSLSATNRAIMVNKHGKTVTFLEDMQSKNIPTRIRIEDYVFLLSFEMTRPSNIVS